MSAPHIRDMLIKPYERTADDLKMWDEALKFVTEQDSRISAETAVLS